MLTVDEALDCILREVSPFAIGPRPLAESLGLTLGADLASDSDSPPFDKALMDGYAVRAADVASDNASLAVIEEVTAGKVPARTVGAGEATRIMTGAPIPDGADAVVRVEDTAFDASTGRVAIKGPVRAGTSILRRGTSVTSGQTVLRAGRLLRSQELGALAELGMHQVPTRRRPLVAVLATGDELAPITATPGPGQVRNSNETMLTAQVRQAGGVPAPMGVARDDRAELSERIRAGLEYDVLLLTGGVSAGKLDLVPSELAAAGVRQVFHKVDVKPGKPVWFGVLDRPSGDLAPPLPKGGQGGSAASDIVSPLNAEPPHPCPSPPQGRGRGVGELGPSGQPRRCYVFGLPGNPVSTLVCFELFARTALRRLMGVEPASPQAVRARLEQSHIARGDRPTYHPARLQWTETGPTVRAVPWHGSSDLCATVDANCMALFPAGDRTFSEGERVDVFVW